MSGKPPPRTAAELPGTASWLRRIGALFIDWIASTLVVVAVVGTERYAEIGNGNIGPLLVFWAETSIGVALAGGSFGQLATRIRVRRTDGRPVSLFRSMARQLLVCLVIPPLVFRPDGRGLHDLWTDTAAFRLR